MIEIHDYNPEKHYDGVVANLRGADMFDETWDSPENVNGLAASADPRNFILVAEDQNEVVGQIVSMPFGPKVAFYWRLSVSEKYRRQGIAHKLVETLEGRLRELGVVDVCALVNSAKPELLEFYEKQDYNYSDNDWKVIWKTTPE